MAEITYLMDRDPAGAGANGYFLNAKGYFEARADSTVVITQPDAAATTLDDVFKDLRARAKDGHVFATVNLVSHATGFSSLQFPISDAHRDDEGGLITADTLLSALPKAGTDGYPAVLGPPAVTKDTKVCLYGCDVGRDAAFVARFGQLFGPELTIRAALRVAVFRHQGAVFEHRLARTWSIPFAKDISRTTAWAPVRTAFVTAAVAKFKPKGGAAVETAIKAAAAAATTTTTASFFFPEQMLADSGSLPSEVSSAVLPAGTVDDTTVPITLKAANFAADPTQPGTSVAWVAVLAQVLEEPVAVDSSTQFRTTVISTQKAASTTALTPPAPAPDVPEDDMDKFYGKYRALVASDVDPTASGRLQVSVPLAGLTDVWAEASLPPVPRSLLSMPAVGSTIWVEFEGGDPSLPVWTGATWDSQADVPADLTIESSGTLTLRAGAVTVASAVTQAQGVVTAESLVATVAVVSPSYTPGAGNVW